MACIELVNSSYKVVISFALQYICSARSQYFRNVCRSKFSPKLKCILFIDTNSLSQFQKITEHNLRENLYSEQDVNMVKWLLQIVVKKIVDFNSPSRPHGHVRRKIPLKFDLSEAVHNFIKSNVIVISETKRLFPLHSYEQLEELHKIRLKSQHRLTVTCG